MKKKLAVFCILFFTVFTLCAQTVKVVQDRAGAWELQVDGKKFFVKGVIWAPNPPGTSHTFSLWNESDATIRKVLDTEGALMAEAGINAVRIGSDIPRKWVEYLYNRHGIYTIIHDTFSRWGATANGRWYFPTNYYVPQIRENIRKESRAIINRYKDATGVLMYMFGDGNGHGLYWSGSDNTPEIIAQFGVDPRYRKARALFSLLEEVFQMTKELDPYRPVGFLTNDLGWIELIAEECPSMDFLGVNLGGDWGVKQAGPDFWRDARQKINKPIVFGSVGMDAWNAKLGSEDQYAQAEWIASQWKDIYANAYGRGQSNALGGCVNEWTDGWYKTDYDSTTGPQVSIHDTQPIGTNEGYGYDFTPGQPNMTPEWNGITSQGPRRYHSWFAQKLPRAAYYTLQQIWSADPWNLDAGARPGDAAVEDYFSKLDMALALSRGLQDSKEWFPDWRVYNQVNLTAMQTGNDVQKTLKEDDQNIFSAFRDNQWGVGLRTTFWGIAQQQSAVGSWLEGAVTLLLRHDALVGEGPVTSVIDRTMEMGLADRPFDVYQAWFTWKGFGAEINANFHYGKGGWTGEGDFFNLNTETYDLYSNDIWDIKAPISLEARYNFGMGGRQGLAVIFGPKIYSGANPMILGKWYQEIDSVRDHTFAYSVMAGQEFSLLDTQLGSWGTPGEYTDPSTSASLWFSWKPWLGFGPFFELQAGLMGTNFNKIGDGYFKRGTDANYYPYDSNGNPIKEGTIEFIDTLSAKLRAEYRSGKYVGAQAELLYAGLVADTNWVPPLMSTIFADIGTGNRIEAKAGISGSYGGYGLTLNGLYRRPLQGPVSSRYVSGEIIHTSDEPFVVGGNRETVSLELIFALDLEPASWIWEWNVWDTEAAKFGTRLRGRYTIFEGPSDPGRRKGADGKYRYDYEGYPESNGNFDVGWMVFWNPSSDLRVGNSLNFTRGFAWNGIPNGTEAHRVTPFGWSEEFRVRYKRLLASGMLAFDLWGPVSSDRENNLTYPLRWSFGLAYGLTPRPSLMDASNRVGVRWNGVIRDRYSPNTTLGRDSQELVLYFDYTF